MPSGHSHLDMITQNDTTIYHTPITETHPKYWQTTASKCWRRSHFTNYCTQNNLPPPLCHIKSTL